MSYNLLRCLLAHVMQKDKFVHVYRASLSFRLDSQGPVFFCDCPSCEPWHKALRSLDATTISRADWFRAQEAQGVRMCRHAEAMQDVHDQHDFHVRCPSLARLRDMAFEPMPTLLQVSAAGPIFTCGGISSHPADEKPCMAIIVTGREGGGYPRKTKVAQNQ